jgi:glycosyltransferase involved in cell wall biosynthesis
MTVRAVLGLPLYDAPATLEEAIESVLTQTRRDYALLLVDEGVSPRVAEIATHYQALDERVSYHRNDTRLGLTRNWKRAFDLALAEHPETEYFAWVSDHDVWNPRWLEAMTGTLDARPEATMAFPDVAILEQDGALRMRPKTRDTSDVTTPGAVLDRIIRGRLRSGHMIYGLFRVEAMRRAGGFRHVLLADRLFLAEVALQGPMIRVPEVLWYRRVTGSFSLQRQRRSCFPGRPPVRAYVPWAVTHAAVLFWQLGVKGVQRPRLGRARGSAVSAVYLWLSWRAVVERRFARGRKRFTRWCRSRLRSGRNALRRKPA